MRLTDESRTVCGTGQLARQTAQVPPGQLPNAFTPNASGSQCAASVYITD